MQPLANAPRYSLRPVERLTIGPDASPALLLRPEVSHTLPALLLQHGYGADKADLLPVATEVAALGFVVLLPDAWGHGERFPASGPSWMTELSADFFFSVVRQTLDDLRAALDVLLTFNGVRQDAIVAGGFSMGGMAALVLGTENPRISGVLALSGSPLPDLRHISLFGSTLASAQTLAWAEEHDAAAHIANLAPKPIFIGHGRQDDMVPIAGALRLYEAARPYYAHAPENLTLRLYNHTHMISQQELDDAASWLLAHFPPQPIDPPTAGASQ